MTSRTIDIHCSRCRRYLFSVQPMTKGPERPTCVKYGKKCDYRRVRRADSRSDRG